MEQSLTSKTFKNVAYNFFGYTWPILFSFFITPIIVSKLGIKSYGLMVVINSLLGILGLLDFGITTATIKHLAEYIGKKDEEKIKETIRTAKSIFLIIGLLGISIVCIFFLFLSIYHSERLINNPEIIPIIILAVLNFFITTINTVYVLVPTAMQRFDISTKLNATVLALVNIFNLIVVLSGGGLVGIFVPQLIITIIFFFIWRNRAKHLLPQISTPMGWSKTEALRNFSWSAYSFINELARTSLFALDRLLMPFYLGASSVTYYTLPGNLTARIPGVSDNLAGTLFPMSANLQGAGDIEKIKRVYIRSTRIIILISTAITLALAVNAYPILKIWISTDVANNSHITMIILAATNFILALMSPIATFLMVFNKWKFYTSISAAMAIINFIALIILMPRFGINGAAFAYLISTIPILYAVFRLEKKYLGVHSFVKRYSQIILKLLTTSVIFVIIDLILIKPFMLNLIGLIILGPLSILLYIVIYFLLGFFEKEDLDDIKTFFKKSLKYRLSND